MSHIDRITVRSFSPDGTVVLTASLDGSARLWDATDGKPLGDPLEHPLAVTSATFSPDGMLVASGCRDGAVRLWDVATQMPVGPPLPATKCHPRRRAFWGGRGRKRSGFSAWRSTPASNRAILASHTAYDARLWEIPGPLTVDDARVGLWVQLTTAAELLPNGTFKPLDPVPGTSCGRAGRRGPLSRPLAYPSPGRVGPAGQRGRAVGRTDGGSHHARNVTRRATPRHPPRRRVPIARPLRKLLILVDCPRRRLFEYEAGHRPDSAANVRAGKARVRTFTDSF